MATSCCPYPNESPLIARKGFAATVEEWINAFRASRSREIPQIFNGL